MAGEPSLIPVEQIERAILLMRGQKVMLDADLAGLYGVTVGRLNEAVKRNRDRFPADFMFQLTDTEFANLKSKIAISSYGWGGRRHPPYAEENKALPCSQAAEGAMRLPADTTIAEGKLTRYLLLPQTAATNRPFWRGRVIRGETPTNCCGTCARRFCRWKPWRWNPTSSAGISSN